MEKEKEITRLVNVLKKTARMAQQAAWAGSDEDAAAYSVEQYNRVLARLVELDPDVAAVFEPLDPDSSLTVVALACRQLAAYYEEETASPGWSRVYGAAFDAESFKDFWRQSARDIEDLGEFIRENLETWARHRTAKCKDDAGTTGAKDQGKA